MRHRLGNLSNGAAHAAAAAHLQRYAAQAQRAMRDPGSAVAFGRIDTDEDDTHYVGYHAIWDDQNDILVVNWQAPIASAYYEASTRDPCGLLLRRDFTTTNNTIVEFHDSVFDASRLESLASESESEVPPISDALREDLERHRTGEMQDIVRTIEQTQYELIRASPDQLLIIQGGPGTGKTVVALHRVSWLLFNHRDRIGPGDVLVVGPNPRTSSRG
jgi:DNA helicase IV